MDAPWEWKIIPTSYFLLAPLEIIPRCSAVPPVAGSDFIIVPVGFNAPLEFLTGLALEARKKSLIAVRNHHFEDGLHGRIVIVAESG